MSDLEQMLEEDISLLVKQLAHPQEIDRAALRVTASAVTRKWLIDRNLIALARELHEVARLPAIDVSEHVKRIEKDRRFRFYVAGGAALDGRPLNSFYDHSQLRDDITEAMLSVPKSKRFTLSKFLGRKCMFYRGHWIKTEDMLRYVANKLGGVHYDSTRDKHAHSVIDEARTYFLLGNDESLQPPDHRGPFVVIRSLPNGIWDCAHIEMLAISQSLCNVRFGEAPFMKFQNLDSQGPHLADDVLLGIRNTNLLSSEEGKHSWILPPVLQNRS